MKLSLLSLLLLPLASVAQFRPSYSPPPMNSAAYQAQANRAVQQIQQRQFQQNSVMRQMQFQSMRTRSLAQTREKQQLAELQADEQLAQFKEAQERKRQQQPAQDAAQALAQQQADAKALNQFKVKTYREVFLPGQITRAQQSLHFSAEAQKQIEQISSKLLDNGWWSGQESTQLPSKLTTYAATLTSLTAALLEFEPASVPAAPAPVAESAYAAAFSPGDFNSSAAEQLIHQAAQAQKIESGAALARAVTAFSTLAASSATAPSPKELRKSVQTSLQAIGKELRQYDFRASGVGRLTAAQKALHKAATAYLAQNS